MRRRNLQQRRFRHFQPFLPRDLSVRHLRGRHADRPRRQYHRSRGGVRDGHLLGRRLQQRLPHPVVPVRGRQVLLRQPQAPLHGDAVQQLPDGPRVPGRRGQRGQLRRRGRQRPELDLRHVGLVADLWLRDHAHQRAARQRGEEGRGLPEPDAVRQPDHLERHHQRWESGVRDGGVHGRFRVGSCDGVGDAELHEDVACFYEFAVGKVGR